MEIQGLPARKPGVALSATVTDQGVRQRNPCGKSVRPGPARFQNPASGQSGSEGFRTALGRQLQQPAAIRMERMRCVWRETTPYPESAVLRREQHTAFPPEERSAQRYCRASRVKKNLIPTLLQFSGR